MLMVIAWVLVVITGDSVSNMRIWVDATQQLVQSSASFKTYDECAAKRRELRAKAKEEWLLTKDTEKVPALTLCVAVRQIDRVK